MDWIQAISSIGFPIVACLAMAWYVKTREESHTRQIEKMNAEHTTEMLGFKDEIKGALNNNTIALTRLCDKLGGGIDDGK